MAPVRKTPNSLKGFRIPKIKKNTSVDSVPYLGSPCYKPAKMQFTEQSRYDPRSFHRSPAPKISNNGLLPAKKSEVRTNPRSFHRSPALTGTRFLPCKKPEVPYRYECCFVPQSTQVQAPVGKSLPEKKPKKIDMFVDSKFVISLSFDEEEQTIHVDDKPVIIRYFPFLDRLRIGNHSFDVAFDGSVYFSNFFNTIRKVSFQKRF